MRSHVRAVWVVALSTVLLALQGCGSASSEDSDPLEGLRPEARVVWERPTASVAEHLDSYPESPITLKVNPPLPLTETTVLKESPSGQPTLISLTYGNEERSIEFCVSVGWTSPTYDEPAQSECPGMVSLINNVVVDVEVLGDPNDPELADFYVDWDWVTNPNAPIINAQEERD